MGLGWCWQGLRVVRWQLVAFCVQTFVFSPDTRN